MNIIVTFTVTVYTFYRAMHVNNMYTYTQYIWNVHKRILKERSVIFDHVAIDYNHYVFRVELVN